MDLIDRFVGEMPRAFPPQTIPETGWAVNAALRRRGDVGPAMHCEHLFRMAKELSRRQAGV
jgi:hypothetical protein